jgi:hypothetical protein
MVTYDDVLKIIGGDVVDPDHRFVAGRRRTVVAHPAATWQSKAQKAD